VNGNGKIFNRALLKRRRTRMAARWPDHDFLKREAALRIADALADVKRTFTFGLDLGCHKGEVGQAIGLRVPTLIGCDLIESMSPRVVCDEELLPFAPDSFDIVVSALSLHHVNDLPGTLIQIRHALKPDGLFIAIMFGASTLKELRLSVTGAAAEQGLALSPRLSPLIEVRDAGALLQRAGFALPVIDSDIVTAEYGDPLKLFDELRAMGESNVLLQQRKTFTSRGELAAIAAHYQSRFGAKDGSVNASFEFVTLTAWKPHASQQQPAARGSGTVNLKQVL
jgi:SAM-dependent methyltransferase